MPTLISVKLVLQSDTSPTLRDYGYGLVYHAGYAIPSTHRGMAKAK